MGSDRCRGLSAEFGVFRASIMASITYFIEVYIPYRRSIYLM